MFPGFWRKSLRQVKTLARERQEISSLHYSSSTQGACAESVEDGKQGALLVIVHPVRLSFAYEAEKASNQENAIFFGTIL